MLSGSFSRRGLIMEPLRAPPELAGAGADLWTRVLVDVPEAFELTERELEILRLACRQVDAVAELEAAVERDGTTVKGSTGQIRVHPAVGEARQAALAAGRLLGMLAIPDDEGEVLTPAQKRAQWAARNRWGVDSRARKGARDGSAA